MSYNREPDDFGYIVAIGVFTTMVVYTIILFAIMIWG